MFLEKNKLTCPFIREVRVVQMLSRFYKKFEIFINMSLMDKLEVNPAPHSTVSGSTEFAKVRF